MAIDYGLKLLVDLFWKDLLNFFEEIGLIASTKDSEILGPVEVTVQERPLRIDYIIRIGNRYLILESKSGYDVLDDDDVFRLTLYAMGISRRYKIPMLELPERVIIIALVPSARNIKYTYHKIRHGIFLLKGLLDIYVLCVEEIELKEDVFWLGIISKNLREKVFRIAMEKENFKTIGIILFIDRELRRLIMSDESVLREALIEIGESIGFGKLFDMLAKDEKVIEEALTEIGKKIGFAKLIKMLAIDEKHIEEALTEIGKKIGFKKLIKILVRDEETLKKTLTEIGETIGYDKFVRIIISILRNVDSKLLDKLLDALKQE